MGRTSFIACAAGAILAAGASAQPVFEIHDGNSSASFDTGYGQFAWYVDGINELFQQSFFYRAGGMNDESSVHSTSLIGTFTADTNPFSDSRDDTLSLLYRDVANALEFEIRYSIQGGTPGSGASDLAEQIIIRNLSSAANAVSFFQYCDFDLNGSSHSDFGEIINGRVASQSEGNRSVTETVVTPAPTFWQIDFFPVIIDLFSDGLPSNLNNNNGPLLGDLTWAFQWDFVLSPGGSFIISKDKLMVPAPASLALVGIGGLVAARRRRA